MKQYDISAFGEILIDFTDVGKNEQNQSLFAQNAGGAPANVLVCASNFNLKTAFLGKVGNDMHGHFLANTLKAYQVNTDGLVFDDNYFTTLAFVQLNNEGERTFSFARKHGADTYMSSSDLNLKIITNSKIFHVGSLSLTTDFGFETTNYAIKQAKQSGALISYDPNYRASLWNSEDDAKLKMRSLITYCDLMKIADEECELLTGYRDHYLAANYLNKQGVKLVCVTLGAQGAIVSTSQNQELVKGYQALNVVDTTGAGDAFWGGFLTQVIKGNKAINELTKEDLISYVSFANAVASLCVEKYGAINAMPQLSNVVERIKK